MNVATDPYPGSIAATTSRNNAPHRADRTAREESPYLGTVDTVEISFAARETSQIHITTKEEFEKMNQDFWVNRYAGAKETADYNAEDLAPLKTRFSNLLDTEKSIYSRIASLMSKKAGTQPGVLDQLKVEIDSKGKAIVGGVSDVKVSRALEKAINSDKKLLKDIAEWQKEEKHLSDDMRDVTGTSLKEYASRIDSLQRTDTKGAKLFVDLDTGELTSSPDSAIALKDQPLYAVDSEFAAMISERYAAGSARLDISGQNNILEDAEGTVNGMMSKVTGDIAQAFRDMNERIRMEAGGMPDSVQYLEDSLVNLNRLKISVDNTGNVTIEGTASKNNAETDRAAKKIVERMFEEELKANPVTGKQHDFKTAATYLLNTYDEAFGEGNPLALGEDDRKLETVFDHGRIESHVSSPEREAELAEEIDTSAKDALKDMGIDATELVIEMNDDGKLAAVNLNPDDAKAKSIQTALDFLNKQLEDRSIEDAREEEIALAMNPVKRLKALMTNMDALRPGGASVLKRTGTTAG